MRVLLIPHTGLKKITAESNYLMFLDLAKHLISKGHFCYMIMPKYAQDQVERIPGLMYVYKDYEYDWYTEYGLINLREMADLFSRVVGKYFIDVLVTAMSLQVPLYQLCLSDMYHQRDIPCIVVNPAVMYYNPQNPIGKMSHWLHCIGYANSTAVFLSPYEKTVALDNCKHFLVPSEVKKVDETSLVLPVGVNCEEIDKITTGLPKFDKFTLFFGGRLNMSKKPERIFELYGKFFSAGHDVQVKMTTNTSETKFSTYNAGFDMYLKYKDAIDIQYSVPRDEYWKIAAQSHVGIAWSDEEGFPVGFWEQMYIGLPVLFPKKPWALSQLPDWYPWVFKDKQEAYSMLLYIKENYDKVVEEMAPMRDFIRENYSNGIIYTVLEDRMLELTQQPRSFMDAKSIKDLILRATELLEPGSTITLYTMLKLLEKLGSSFPAKWQDRVGRGSMPRDYEIYKMMLQVGYVDTYKRAKPELIVPERGVD